MSFQGPVLKPRGRQELKIVASPDFAGGTHVKIQRIRREETDWFDPSVLVNMGSVSFGSVIEVLTGQPQATPALLPACPAALPAPMPAPMPMPAPSPVSADGSVRHTSKKNRMRIESIESRQAEKERFEEGIAKRVSKALLKEINQMASTLKPTKYQDGEWEDDWVSGDEWR
jgi:hypothetical protein